MSNCCETKVQENVCGCCKKPRSREDGKSEVKIKSIRLSLSFCLLIAGIALEAIVAEFALLPIFIAAFFLSGYEVVWTAVKNCFKGKVFDENFLMTIAALGAFAIGQTEEGVAVMIFYGFGELLQEIAVNRSKKNISKLMDIRPDFAHVKIGNGETAETKTINPAEVSIGDIILVKPGEKIPLDGILVFGQGFIDTRALTGESVPRQVVVGDEVLSGSVNTTSVLEIKVSKLFGESTVSKILELVQNAQSKKAESEKFITKFSHVYTPIVVCTAVVVAIAPPLLGFGTFSAWLYKALSFLIISCPCALVVSIPVSFFGGIGGAARQGILIKGGNFLEALNNLTTIVFDKTGTLTKGIFEVSEILPAKEMTKESLIEIAAIAEQHSNHPIAVSIMRFYGKSLAIKAEMSEQAGFGVTAQTDKGTIACGNKKLMNQLGIVDDLPNSNKTIVYLALDGVYAGAIIIADTLKDSAKAGIAALKEQGIKNLIMLTGDHAKIAQDIAQEAGLTEYKAELLPQDKVSEFEKIVQQQSLSESKKQKNLVAFVGDGINDAPVLTRADVGIAMGGIGSDAAIEAADVVIMNDDIQNLARAIRIAKKTRRIVTENIVFSLGVKCVVMLSAVIFATPIWLAIFADVGVSLLAVVNALRAMKAQ